MYFINDWPSYGKTVCLATVLHNWKTLSILANCLDMTVNHVIDNHMIINHEFIQVSDFIKKNQPPGFKQLSP